MYVSTYLLRYLPTYLVRPMGGKCKYDILPEVVA